MDLHTIKHRFQLEECLHWIVANNFRRVIIQFKTEDLKYSLDVVNYLKDEYLKQSQGNSTDHTNNPQALDIYIVKSNTCCIDLIVTQHISNVDAIIHLGKVCLSEPQIKNQQSCVPILFAFGQSKNTLTDLDANIISIQGHIESILSTNPNHSLLIIYDTSLVDHALRLDQIFAQNDPGNHVEVARLFSPNTKWTTTSEHQTKLLFEKPDAKSTILGQYVLNKSIDDYNCVIYLGDRLSIQLTLKCPSKLYKINCYKDTALEQVNVSRTLNRRMALVGRLKDEEELNIGVILTNPLPDIECMMELLESYAKVRKHTLYFISMIQTIDECKIGNFDLCDAFIVFNACNCSTILESLVFNRPILTDHEFKLACGFEAEYGRVLWPGSTCHLTADDIMNKRKVSDVSLALIHTRNELLERCSQARGGKWSGMDYRATGEGSSNGGVDESLAIGDGLCGIASTYASEPLKKLEGRELAD